MYDYEYELGAKGSRSGRKAGHPSQADVFDNESVGSRQTSGNISTSFRSQAQNKFSDNASYASVSPSVHTSSGLSTATESTGIAKSLRYDEHTMSLEELVEAYGTAVNLKNPIASTGLSGREAHIRQQSFGKNIMSHYHSEHPLKMFLLQFTDTFMILLEFAAFLSLLSYTLEENEVDLYIGEFLLGAVFLQCIATYRQEARSDQLMESFRMLAPQYCICIREGVQLRIDSEQLVVGDLVKLYTGVKVPSDCRLIHISSGYLFRVDQSSITGENEPVECNCVPSKEANVLDAYNVIFGGSLVVEGEALAIVIRSGDKTLLGDMVRITGEVQKGNSTLKDDLKDFVWVVARLSVGLGLVVFLLGMFRGLPLMETLMDGLVVTIIANVPCGLPATVTACLLIVAERLRSNNVFIKALDGIETLGACSLICTDKTGTLTQNSMSVSHAWVIEDNNAGVFVPQVSTLLTSEKFIEACVSGTGSAAVTRDVSEENLNYRIRTNGFSDMSAAALLLHISTLNSRVSLTQVSPPPFAEQSFNFNLEDFEYDIEASRRGLLDESTTSHLTMHSAYHRPTGQLQPTGDATEVGIYKFCQHVTAVCHRYVKHMQEAIQEAPTETHNPLNAPAVARGAPAKSLAETISSREALQRNAVKQSAPTTMFPSDCVEDIRDHFEKVLEIPFNSVNKWQMSIHDTGLDLFDITDSSYDAERKAIDAVKPTKDSGVRTAVPAHPAPSGSPKRSSESVRSGRAKGFSLRKAPTPEEEAAKQPPKRSDIMQPPTGVNPYPEFMCVKGAPDVLIPKCSHFVVTQKGGKGHRMLPVDPAWRSCVTAAFEEMAAQGERALAYAIKWMPTTVEEAEENNPDYKMDLKDSLVGRNRLTEEKNLCFVGLLSLNDPPRKEVPGAIAACGGAGIQVVMVTGDYPATAQAIARKIGIMSFPTRPEIAIQKGIPEHEVPESDVRAVTVHGSKLDSMSESDWKRLVMKDQIVFARTSPEQKLTIVEHFLKAGHIVAMTGDGINDSPALKQASIGIAMGVAGSDVAREAADIVLLDDNFASIVFSIKEGRLLFDNLKKSIAYTLTHLMPQLIPIMIHFAFGWPLGLPAVLALCIDLIAEVFPAAAFAYESPETDIMTRPPRSTKVDRMVGPPLLIYSYLIAGVFETIGCMLVYFETFIHYGFSLEFIVTKGHIYFKEDSPDVVIDVRYKEEPTDDVIGEFNGYHRNYTAEEQMQILHRVQSAYFLSLILIQGLHIFQVRARSSSIFSRGIFENFRIIIGVCISVGIGFGVTFLHLDRFDFIETENPPADAISYGTLTSFALLFGFNELRKLWLSRLRTKRDMVVDQRTGAVFEASKFADPTNRNHRLHVRREFEEQSTCEVAMSW